MRRVIYTLPVAWLLCGGCATIRPSYYDVNVTHVSHLSQHFTAHPTRHGYNEIAVQAVWDTESGVYVSLAEGVIIEPCGYLDNRLACGSLLGPREVFTGTVGYKFGSKAK